MIVGCVAFFLSSVIDAWAYSVVFIVLFCQDHKGIDIDGPLYALRLLDTRIVHLLKTLHIF